MIKIIHKFLLIIIILHRIFLYNGAFYKMRMKDIALMLLIFIGINLLCYIVRKVLDFKTRNTDVIDELLDEIPIENIKTYLLY